MYNHIFYADVELKRGGGGGERRMLDRAGSNPVSVEAAKEVADLDGRPSKTSSDPPPQAAVSVFRLVAVPKFGHCLAFALSIITYISYPRRTGMSWRR
jgi:hypothetical protein